MDLLENALAGIGHEQRHLRDAAVGQNDVGQFELIERYIEDLAAMRFVLHGETERMKRKV